MTWTPPESNDGWTPGSDSDGDRSDVFEAKITLFSSSHRLELRRGEPDERLPANMRDMVLGESYLLEPRGILSDPETPQKAHRVARRIYTETEFDLVGRVFRSASVVLIYQGRFETPGICARLLARFAVADIPVELRAAIAGAEPWQENPVTHPCIYLGDLVRFAKDFGAGQSEFTECIAHFLAVLHGGATEPLDKMLGELP